MEPLLYDQFTSARRFLGHAAGSESKETGVLSRLLGVAPLDNNDSRRLGRGIHLF